MHLLDKALILVLKWSYLFKEQCVYLYLQDYSTVRSEVGHGSTCTYFGIGLGHGEIHLEKVQVIRKWASVLDEITLLLGPLTDSSSFLTPALFARLSLRNHNYSSNKTHPKIINRISLRYWVMYQVHVYTNIHTQPWLMRTESRWGLIAEEQPFNTWSLQLVNMRPVRTVKHTNQLNSDLP